MSQLQERITAPKVLRTADVSKAAYLVTKGARLIEGETFDGGRVYFSFSDYDRCRAYLGEIDLNPPVGIQDFLKALQQVKAVLQTTREAR
jgi:hypothetical protein